VVALRFVKCSSTQRHLLSFPTRRSSDLIELQTDGADDPNVKSIEVTVRIASGPPGGRLFGTTTVRGEGGACEFHNLRVEPPGERSEEHTSELQSRENLVCRLLLEKKKKR